MFNQLFIHLFTNIFIHSLIHQLSYPFIYSSINWFVYLFIDLNINYFFNVSTFVYLFVYQFICLFIHLFVYLPFACNLFIPCLLFDYHLLIIYLSNFSNVIRCPSRLSFHFITYHIFLLLFPIHKYRSKSFTWIFNIF